MLSRGTWLPFWFRSTMHHGPLVPPNCLSSRAVSPTSSSPGRLSPSHTRLNFSRHSTLAQNCFRLNYFYLSLRKYERICLNAWSSGACSKLNYRCVIWSRVDNVASWWTDTLAFPACLDSSVSPPQPVSLKVLPSIYHCCPESYLRYTM